MRVLVVGATGFIGTRVVDDLVLRRHAAVRATVRDFRRAIRIARLPVDMIRIDASDAEALSAAAKDLDAVVLCAHPFGSTREDADAIAIVRAAVAAAAATTSRRLVFVSSAAIYGSQRAPIDDSTEPSPRTPYARSKLRCEQIISAAHAAATVRSVVVRPSIVYGPFSRSWTALPARQMAGGSLVLPTAAPGACNAVFVDDVARAVTESVFYGGDDQLVVNINGQTLPSWYEFYDAVAAAVRPGAVHEWPLARINQVLADRERSRGNLPAIRRALRDLHVRNRLAEIPALARINALAKSLRWRGLPPVEAEPTPDATRPAPATTDHLPDPLRLDLYLHAPPMTSSPALSALGVSPRPFARGIEPTRAWLAWAGLA
jgi:nucleoside-diphosphate-sugar epimerase